MKKVLQKLGSVKVWIALWSMFLITFITMRNMTDFNNLAMLAMAPVVAYLGANVWGDKIHLDTNKTKGQGDEK